MSRKVFIFYFFLYKLLISMRVADSHGIYVLLTLNALSEPETLITTNTNNKIDLPTEMNVVNITLTKKTLGM